MKTRQFRLLVLLGVVIAVFGIILASVDYFNIQREKAFQRDKAAVKARALEFYESLSKEQYEKIWDMMHPSLQRDAAESREKYVEYLKAFLKGTRISYSYTDAEFVKGDGVTTPKGEWWVTKTILTLATPDNRTFNSCDRIEWIFRDGKWLWVSSFQRSEKFKCGDFVEGSQD